MDTSTSEVSNGEGKTLPNDLGLEVTAAKWKTFLALRGRFHDDWRETPCNETSVSRW